MEVEIGIGKSGRRAYGFDDIAIVPAGGPETRRTSTSPGSSTPSGSTCRCWRAAMDGVVSPATAMEIGRIGGLAVLNLEGLWTRYENPEPLLEEIAELADEKATLRMQQIYAEPIKDELIGARIEEIKASGVTHAPPRSRRRRPSATPRRYSTPSSTSS